MNQSLLDVLALAGAVVAVLADGRVGVVVAAFAAAAGLAAAAAVFGGGWAAVLLLGAFVAAVGTAALGRALASAARGHSGGADLASAGARRRESLFGPRTLRLVAAAVALPAASWISFNVALGSVVVVQGRLFPVAVVFAIGCVRVLLARTLTDLATGVAVIAIATGVAWLLRGGGNPLPATAGVLALVPLVAGVEAWLGARPQTPVAGRS
jgi:hypothetical protein